jgi:hypothetical protein
MRPELTFYAARHIIRDYLVCEEQQTCAVEQCVVINIHKSTPYKRKNKESQTNILMKQTFLYMKFRIVFWDVLP